MNSNIEKVLDQYIDNALSPEEISELMAWAGKSDKNAAKFAKACAIDQMTDELFKEGRIGIPRVSSRLRPAAFIWTMAAAITLSTVGFLLWFNLQSDVFAVVAQSVGARTPEGLAVSTDRAVGRETIELSSGLIRLDFDHGASMTVEGPARFEIRDSMHVFFEEGVATFQVPEAAKGFTVDTADTEVVDLGTAFGLSRRKNGETDVCVFEGEVKVGGKLIRGGQAVSARKGHDVQASEYETDTYERAWPVSSGVLQTTGMLKFVSPGPGFVPGKFEDNKRITVFLEREKVSLEKPLEVDLADPGEYRQMRSQEAPEIPPGTIVTSYLLQLDPVGFLDKWDGDKPRVSGQITFDRPILGLIAQGKKLLATDLLVGHPEGDYGNLRRGIEAPKESLEEAESLGKDVLILAADQRTLILNFAAASAVDQIRVLVASDP